MENHAPNEFHPRIRALSRKYDHTWSGNLGHINATTHRIDLAPGARSLKPELYSAGPKARELEEFEIKLQLSPSVIEHSNA